MTAAVDPAAALAAVRGVRKGRVRAYRRYWRALADPAPEAAHARWVYALCSVNQNVAEHLRTFRYACRFEPGFSRALRQREFARRFTAAGRGGMFAVRAAALWRFDAMWREGPKRFAPERPTAADRDLLVADVFGLGPAKAAFALELVAPETCTAVCLDRHLLRLFALEPSAKVRPAVYAAAEAVWARACRLRGLEPALARWAWWDARFGYADCRWWSFVFEPHFDRAAWARARTPW